MARVARDRRPLDLVDRQFRRDRANELWLTDITEHPTREGKVYCAVVLDAFSRRVVGWSIDSTRPPPWSRNALGMAIEQPRRGRRHGDPLDHGSAIHLLGVHPARQRSGLLPSMGSVGDCYDNGMMESFWSRMQVELLDPQRWTTRLESRTRSSTTSRSSTTANAATLPWATCRR